MVAQPDSEQHHLRPSDKTSQLKVVPELRSQTTATRFRLPDVSVLHGAPDGCYLTAPALIAIEVLSEADRMSVVMEKLHEYDAHGIPNVGVIDPRLQQLSIFRSGVLQDVHDDAFYTVDREVRLTRSEIFQA